MKDILINFENISEFEICHQINVPKITRRE